ncbi:MAG: hypothetical protein FWF52_02405 [Candidatus Azobacteroides sp.]|nr:hypothetical protein [Candidatus Azobacteroides sp.]
MVDEIKKIKKYLPKRYIQTLAEEFGCTGTTILNTLNGRTRRFDIIERAIELAREVKEKNQKILEELKEFS